MAYIHYNLKFLSIIIPHYINRFYNKYKKFSVQKFIVLNRWKYLQLSYIMTSHFI